MVDLSFDPRASIAITPVTGVVAVAGPHALRLDSGKLYETDDGWTTWTEIEPPPTGAPPDLARAMCSPSGCVLGPWARIGWRR